MIQPPNTHFCLAHRCKEQGYTQYKECKPTCRLAKPFCPLDLRNEVCTGDIEEVPRTERNKDVHIHALTNEIGDDTAKRESQRGKEVVKERLPT